MATVALMPAVDVYAGDEIRGKVLAILDGNTVQISLGNDDVRTVLLAGIDSPELGQPLAEESRKLLESMIFRKDVTVQITGRNGFGEYIAIVKVSGKIDPRLELLKKGLAWITEKYPDKTLEPYSMAAQQGKKGLWREKNPVPPWTYRRQQTMLVPKTSA